MSFVERFIILCPYLGESTLRGSVFECLFLFFRVLFDVPLLLCDGGHV